GATSHAAVVARGAGLPCVAGCEAIRVDEEKHLFTASGKTIKEGDSISIDGGSGEVFLGEIKMVRPDFDKDEELKTLLAWADEMRLRKSRKGVKNSPELGLQVWANGDYPRDARMAIKFGAQGIGLCRTEHMFFETDRLPIVQKMILSKTDAERQTYLDQLLPIQREDFYGIFEAMGELPVVIRTIDPPLHEFLPSHEQLLVEVTELRVRGNNPALLKEKEEMLKAVEGMREQNPMLGLRGCRLGITMPQITLMQTRAIIEAACQLKKRGVNVHPEIMIPLVGHVNELKNQRELADAEAQKVIAEQGVELEYKIGTMIEIPRGALTAGEIAEYAQFFSFGTNDLTQTTYGYSRDDAEGKFLLKYVETKILPVNPFQQLDQIGVGRLMQIAVTEGRATKPNLKVGICGEHGGDPSSIEFCHRIGLNYVSCSPYRVPVARLAAAQAAVAKSK
ncbi:MAG: pyruvate, phosphate dikinase, partial [Anaerolineales bacterium]|nr:pyruvate, phosphate dikinase [Anaerolineales bacterium]